MKPGRRFLLPIGLFLCQATCSSVSGVSMATTKRLHQMHPLYPSLYLCLLRVGGSPRAGSRPGLLRGSLASWLPLLTPRFGFSLLQAGWGRGVVKETGFYTYVFIYLIFSLWNFFHHIWKLEKQWFDVYVSLPFLVFLENLNCSQDVMLNPWSN